MNIDPYSAAKGVAVLAVVALAGVILWKGKKAIEAVAGAANDALDVAFTAKKNEAPAANPISRTIDAIVTGTTRDVNGTLAPTSSLGTSLYDYLHPGSVPGNPAPASDFGPAFSFTDPSTWGWFSSPPADQTTDSVNLSDQHGASGSW